MFMKGLDLDMTMVKKKCLLCGKEFTAYSSGEVACTGDCKAIYNSQKKKILSKIATIEKKYDFQTKNVRPIVMAKIRAFGDGNVHRCPCDADNPDRYCGSARCIADVVYQGHCHCNLFHSKKEPLLKDNKELK